MKADHPTLGWTGVGLTRSESLSTCSLPIVPPLYPPYPTCLHPSDFHELSIQLEIPSYIISTIALSSLILWFCEIFNENSTEEKVSLAPFSVCQCSLMTIWLKGLDDVGNQICIDAAVLITKISHYISVCWKVISHIFHLHGTSGKEKVLIKKQLKLTFQSKQDTLIWFTNMCLLRTQ